MNAITTIDPAPAADDATPTTLAARHDGWTPARQRLFLEALAAGHTVIDACSLVGLSHQSAYAFRNRPGGAAFALGWQAAQLLARQHLADTLYVRAVEGQVDTVTRPDGATWHRHRFDNRLAATMLDRLDRMAEQAARSGTHRAARSVADQFEAFLESLPEQCLPGPDGKPSAPQLPQLRGPTPPPEADDFAPEVHEDPVWWSSYAEAWRTRFPPPEDFDGYEDGEFGDPDYSRALTEEERDCVEAPERIARAVRRITEGRARDAWFAALALADADAADSLAGEDDAAGGDAGAGDGASAAPAASPAAPPPGDPADRRACPDPPEPPPLLFGPQAPI